MSTVLTSPVPEFPGTITLPDKLPIHKVAAWNTALKETYKYTETIDKANNVMLPALLPCIEAWAIVGQTSSPTPETFNYTPWREAEKFYVWVFGSVFDLIMGAESIPNVLPPVPTDTPLALAESQTN